MRCALVLALAVSLTVLCVRLPMTPMMIASAAVFWSLLIWESAIVFPPRVGATMARLGIICAAIAFACVVASPAFA